jgi:hypothetical protein
MTVCGIGAGVAALNADWSVLMASTYLVGATMLGWCIGVAAVAF